MVPHACTIGGFSRSGLVSRFLSFSSPFWDFPDVSGAVPISSGIRPIGPCPLSRPIRSTYLQGTVHDMIRTFPERTPPIWKPVDGFLSVNSPALILSKRIPAFPWWKWAKSRLNWLKSVKLRLLKFGQDWPNGRFFLCFTVKVLRMYTEGFCNPEQGVKMDEKRGTCLRQPLSLYICCSG